MRRAAHIDGNQAEIVTALEANGFTVQSLASVGEGVPDLLVGVPIREPVQVEEELVRGFNVLLEVKNAYRPPSRRKLNHNQVAWHADWRGQVVKVESWIDAVRHCRALRRRFFIEVIHSPEVKLDQAR